MNKKVVDIADALGECLEEIEAGRLTVEECLERYPDYAADLRELLKTQQKLQHISVIQPAAAFQQQARAHLLNQLSASSTNYPLFITAIFDQWTRLGAFRLRRRFSMAWLLLFVVAASVIAGGGTAFAADAAVPGDPLYSLDRSLEKIRAELTNSPEALLKLQLANAQERLTEAKKLADHRGDGTFRQALNGYGETMLATAMTLGLAEGVEQANLDSMLEQTLLEHDPQLAGLLDDDDPAPDDSDPDDPDEDDPAPDDLDEEDLDGEDLPDGDTKQDKGNYCPPDEANPHPVAVELSITYSETVTPTAIMDWFCGDIITGTRMGMGQIMLALRTAKELLPEKEHTYNDLLEARSDGASWGHIWQCLELNGNGNCKLENFGGSEQPGKPDKPDKPGKPEDKSTGPPDHSNRPDEPPGKSGNADKGSPDKNESNGNNGNGNGSGKKNK